MLLRYRSVLFAFLLSLGLQNSVSALVDVTLEGAYISGTVGGAAANGVAFNPKFSGFMIKPSAHLNYAISFLTVGVGPTVSFPTVTNRDLPAATISDTVSMIRYGGEIYGRLTAIKLLQPFLRFEIGKDNITETNSGYPTITTGSSAGTVDTTSVANIKFSYGSIYYVMGGGIQSQILPFLDLFVSGAFTFSGASTPEVKSFTINGAPVTNYTVNGAFSYTGFQVGLGAMLHF